MALPLVAAGCDNRSLIEITSNPDPPSDAGISTDGGPTDASSGDASNGPDASDAGLSAVLIGITPNPRGDHLGGPTAGDQVEAELVTIAAGARAVVLSHPWNAIDPETLDAIKTSAAFYGKHGLRILMNLAVVDRAADARPPAFKSLAWNDPLTRAALDQAITKLLLSFGAELKYVTFGRDVDVYLADHPAERAAFTELAAHACAFTRTNAQAPAGLEVGVAFSLDGASQPDPSYAQLLGASDIAVLSYLPGLGGPQPGLPTDATAAADAMISAASGKPIVLQALGYPSSPAVNSSEPQQRLFYETFFGALAPRRAAFSMVNLFQLHDLAPVACDAYATAQHEAPGSPLATYTCSAGLFTPSHLEKLAWTLVLQGSATFASP